MKITLEKIKVGKYTSRRMSHTDHVLEITDVNGDIAYAGDLAAAAEALGVTKGAICHCAKGRCEYVKGCKVRWVDSVTLKPITEGK